MSESVPIAQRFFQPAGAWVGDVIPVTRGDELHLYYLHERRESPHEGTGWNLAVTRDLVHFEDRGQALPPGGPDAPDFNAYTGSVVVGHDGTQHLFYTGQNPARLGPDGRPLQVVMHAVSTDGRTWSKLGDDTFGAGRGYETGDWRDPAVFWDPAQRCWRMAITARHEHGPARRRGVIAQYVSTDLSTWSPADPIWDPNRHIAHECPDIVRWGDWWYLFYSEFSDSFATRYRMARSPLGPWLAPPRDTVDGRSFYAAKSAERHGRRFLFGWIATRAGAVDDGAWEWAGTLATLEARQHPDGTLGFTIPQEVLDDAGIPVPLDGATGLRVGRADGHDAVVLPGELGDLARIDLDVDLTDPVGAVGLLLRATEDGDEAWALRLEPQRGRLVLDRWPRPTTGGEQWQISGDVPHAVELERPCDLGPGRHRLQVLLDRDLLLVTVDGDVTLSTRIHARPGDRLGVFAADGVATVLGLAAATDVDDRTAAPLTA